MSVQYVHDMTGRYIYDIPSQWLEQCLAVMALDPDTAGDHANQPDGLVCGVARPEYGPAIYDLQCQMCDATWSGVPGDPCQWCERAAERQIGHQIDLLLTGPDTDPQDASYENRMKGWADRMAIGVKAGIITPRQAKTAWTRATKAAA